jgi:hypothetical protein
MEQDEFEKIKGFCIGCKYEIAGTIVGLLVLVIAIAISRAFF